MSIDPATIAAAGGALLLALGGCAPRPDDPASAWRMPPMAAPPPATTPLVDGPGDLPDAMGPRDDPFWRWDERRAVVEARGAGKGLMIDFHADWCDRCKELDRYALEDPVFRFRVQQHFVPLRVDVTETTAAQREQLERYEVDRLPAVLFVDEEGRLTRRFDEVVPLRELLDELP